MGFRGKKDYLKFITEERYSNKGITEVLERPPMLAAGSLVQLKCGGPIMVIHICNYSFEFKDNTYDCIWFPLKDNRYRTWPTNYYTKIFREKILQVVLQDNIKESFEVGDIVQLKCGGPPMVISEIKGNLHHCVWSDKDGLIYTTDRASNGLHGDVLKSFQKDT